MFKEKITIKENIWTSNFNHVTHWNFVLIFQEKVAKTACMSACQHIASRLMALLQDNEIRHLTMGALQQFNLDVMQCERENFI